jgi:hypothetical protein
MTGTENIVSDDAIVDDIFASDRDRGADSAAPEPQAKEPVEPSLEAKGDEPKADGEDGSSKQYRDPDTGRFVPLTELKTEREKRPEVEARLRAESEQRSRMEAELAAARRYAAQAQQQFQQPVQQPEAPDPWTDPQGYQAFVEQRAELAALNQRLNMSEMIAEEKFGREVIDKATRWAQQNGLQRSFIGTRHPYGELVSAYQRAEAMHKIGDPTDFEKRVREEERQKVLEELKRGPASTQHQRFPGTLSDASAAGTQGRVLTDEAIVDDLFSSDRRRRA